MPRLRWLAALIVLAGAGVASASIVVPHHQPAWSPADLEPAAPHVWLAARTPVPDGLPWVLRLYRSKTGDTCAEPGRLLKHQFGQLAAGGRFVVLPLGPSGTCANLGDGPLSLAMNRYAARQGHAAQTVIFGVASPRVRSVVLHSSEGADDIPLDRGAFLIVRPGPPESGLLIEVRSRDGTIHRYPLPPPG